jgi:hypothetical protein
MAPIHPKQVEVLGVSQKTTAPTEKKTKTGTESKTRLSARILKRSRKSITSAAHPSTFSTNLDLEYALKSAPAGS